MRISLVLGVCVAISLGIEQHNSVEIEYSRLPHPSSSSLAHDKASIIHTHNGTNSARDSCRHRQEVDYYQIKATFLMYRTATYASDGCTTV